MLLTQLRQRLAAQPTHGAYSWPATSDLQYCNALVCSALERQPAAAAIESSLATAAWTPLPHCLLPCLSVLRTRAPVSCSSHHSCKSQLLAHCRWSASAPCRNVVWAEA
jgi:hypothetical protein